MADFDKENVVAPKNKWKSIKRSVAPNLVFEYIVEYLNWAKSKDDTHLVTESGFKTWLFESKAVIINMSKLRKENPEFVDMFNIIKNKTVSTVESMGIFGFSGQGSVFNLILKNNGYEERIINQNVEMPSFSFGVSNEDKEEA